MIPGARLSVPAAISAALLVTGLLIPVNGQALVPIPRPRVTVSALAGGVQPDPALAAHRWSASVRPSVGGELSTSWDRLTTGLRVSTWSARQSIVLPGAETSVSVRALSVDALIRMRAVSVSRFHLLGTLHAGRLHLNYDPEVIPLPTEAGTEATFSDLGTWVGGAGLVLEGRFGGSVVGLEAVHTSFSLDTTRRDGDAVVTRREPYGSWSLWLRVGFSLPAPPSMEKTS